MREISDGLQTMRSFSFASSSEQLWPARPDTDRTVLSHVSTCCHLAGNMSSKFLAYVSLLSVLHTWWVAYFCSDKMCSGMLDEINSSNAVMFVTCLLKTTLRTALSLSDGLSSHVSTHAVCRIHFMSSIACFHPPSFYLCSSLTIDYEEDYEDVTVNQMLAPKSQDTDTTEILNNLLKEYDKKLRPDIGGNQLFSFTHVFVTENMFFTCRLWFSDIHTHINLQIQLLL